MARVYVHTDVADLLRLSNKAEVIALLTGGEAKKIVRYQGGILTRTARALAPKLTGDLSGSIKGKFDGFTATVTAGIRYAQFMEYGTYKDEPQPYMNPALDKVAPRFEHLLTAKIIELMEGL